jgi:hypothetical protein
MLTLDDTTDFSLSPTAPTVNAGGSATVTLSKSSSLSSGHTGHVSITNVNVPVCNVPGQFTVTD